MTALELFDWEWAWARAQLHADIDAAARRAHQHINRCAGQHRRHLMKEIAK